MFSEFLALSVDGGDCLAMELGGMLVQPQTLVVDSGHGRGVKFLVALSLRRDGRHGSRVIGGARRVLLEEVLDEHSEKAEQAGTQN